MTVKLPYFSDGPQGIVKVVQGADGRVHAWQLDIHTGGWRAVDHLIEVLASPENAPYRTKARGFLFDVEKFRGLVAKSPDPAAEIYAEARKIHRWAADLRRPLRTEETTRLVHLYTRSFPITEEYLRRQGDPGADPDLFGPDLAILGGEPDVGAFDRENPERQRNEGVAYG